MGEWHALVAKERTFAVEEFQPRAVNVKRTRTG